LTKEFHTKDVQPLKYFIKTKVSKLQSNIFLLYI